MKTQIVSDEARLQEVIELVKDLETGAQTALDKLSKIQVTQDVSQHYKEQALKLLGTANMALEEAGTYLKD